jgi:hypothetical protein
MRQITISFSLFTLLLSSINPGLAEDEGVPGRRVGGGTRYTSPKIKPSTTIQNRLSAMGFASRTHLPIALRMKAMYS